jgi:hypothetical protein
MSSLTVSFPSCFGILISARKGHAAQEVLLLLLLTHKYVGIIFTEPKYVLNVIQYACFLT